MSILVNKDTEDLSRASPARPGPSTRSSAWSTARRWSGASRRARAAARIDGVPVFDTVTTRSATGANATMIFVPPAFAADADHGGGRRGHRLVVSSPRASPSLDMVRAKPYLDDKTRGWSARTARASSRPGECKIGIMPGYIHKPGNVGVISQRHADLRGGLAS